jgi:hypothetical protein
VLPSKGSGLKVGVYGDSFGDVGALKSVNGLLGRAKSCSLIGGISVFEGMMRLIPSRSNVK